MGTLKKRVLFVYVLVRIKFGTESERFYSCMEIAAVNTKDGNLYFAFNVDLK